MRKLKLLVAASVALVAFAALASSAMAYRAAISPAGRVAAASEGKVTFGSEPQIRCNLTLNHTLASSVELTAGSQIGSVTEVTIRNCEGGSVSAVLGLPWSVTVNSILGTLPDNATGVLLDINGAAFNLSVFGGFVNCLYSGVAGALLAANDTGTNTYSTGQIIALEEVQLPFIRGSFLCPSEGGFGGTFNLSTTQSLTVS